MEIFTLEELESVPDVPGIFEFGDEHMQTIYLGSSGAERLKMRWVHYRKDKPDVCLAASAYYFRHEACGNNTAWQARMLDSYIKSEY